MADDANTRMEQALAGLQAAAQAFEAFGQVCQTAAESFTALHQALTEDPEDTVQDPENYEDDYWDDDYSPEIDERGAAFWAGEDED